MLEISKSDRFKKDYETYYSAISALDDSEFKSKMSGTLIQLVNEVKKLDSFHNEMIYSGQISSTGHDIKTTILELRRTLDSNLKEYFKKD